MENLEKLTKNADQTQIQFLNRDVIKYIAMVTMLLNHIATIFLKTGTLACEVFLALGYFTAISMIYFLVEGYHYTRSRKTYFFRLLIFAFISEIPYCIAFAEKGIIEFYGLNMFFTLCLCFGLIWVMENVSNKALRICAVIAAIVLSVPCSWALLAPIFTMLFIWAGTSQAKKVKAFAVSIGLFAAFNLLGGISNFDIVTNLLYAVLAMLGMGLSALCILCFYNGKRMKSGQVFSKWFFYLFYPLHLLILGIIRIALL